MSTPQFGGPPFDTSPASWPPAPVRTGSLRIQVFEIIRDAIFAGKIQPGHPLRELHLAKSMGVSQSTIREALSQLEHVGLVVRQPNRGATVTRLSGKEVRDRLKLRLALEEHAMAEAAASISNEDLEGLTADAEAIRGAISRNCYFDLGQSDLAFHRRIWQATGNPVLIRILDLITTPLFAFLGVLQQMTSVSLQETQPHEPLITALRMRDPEAARQAMRDHIMLSFGFIMSASPRDLEERVTASQVDASRGSPKI